MKSRARRIELVLIAVVVACGLTAWGIGAIERGFDYDEVQRAHSVWLASRGLRPYHEMFEVHPPYFVLLSPLLGTGADPCGMLMRLRLFATLGNLAFLAALVALGARSENRRWACLGVACVAFHPAVLDFLVEYRIDGWGYALAAWSIWGFEHSPYRHGRFATFGVLSGIATVGLCPKLALLVPLVVLFAWVRERPGWRRMAWEGLSFVGGLAVAGVLFTAYLAANKIALDHVYALLFRYHTLSNCARGIFGGADATAIEDADLAGADRAGGAGMACEPGETPSP